MKKNQIITLTLFAWLIYMWASFPVLAADGDEGALMKVTEDTYVYEEPSVDSDVIIDAYEGTEIIVLSKYNFDWFKVYFYDEESESDVIGYISNDSLDYRDEQVISNLNSTGTFTPMEINEEPDAIPEGFREVLVRINGVTIFAWTNDEYYIFYAESPTGNQDWYLYDSIEKFYIKYDSSFMAGNVDLNDDINEKSKVYFNVLKVVRVLLFK